MKNLFRLCLVALVATLFVSTTFAQSSKPYRPIEDKPIIDPAATDRSDVPYYAPVEDQTHRKQPPSTFAPTIIPAAGSVPVIDGVISAGEWTDALTLSPYNLTGTNIAYVKNDACYLYIAARIYRVYADNSATMLNIWFDLNQNNMWDPTDGNMALPSPGFAFPGLASWSNLGTITNQDYNNFTMGSCSWGTATGRFRYHRPWMCRGVSIPGTQVQVVKVVGASYVEIEAKIDIANSPLKMTAGIPVNMRIQWYSGYYTPTGSGAVTIVAQWPNLATAAYFNGPVPTLTELKDITTTYVPALGDILEVATIEVDGSTNYAWQIGQGIPVKITGTTNPPPQTTPVTAVFTGPLPGVGTTTVTTSVTLTAPAGSTTINIPTVGLTKGFYELAITVDDPGPCGISKKAIKYRVMILNPGEAYCVVWPGDKNNDGVCNLSDRSALNKYVFDANLNPLWLNGPTRYLVGLITGTSSPLDIYTWKAQAAFMWYTPNGCYIDADGNGTINSFDLFAIKFNNGKIHNFSPKDGSEARLPSGFDLEQNFPNPFNPSTVISYALPEESFVTLRITDALGREVSLLVNEQRSAGTHELTFDASALPSGIYFYSITARGLQSGSEFTRTMKMSLAK